MVGNGNVRPNRRKFELDGIVLNNREIQRIIDEKQPITYRDLCDRLGLPMKSGATKNTQIKHLNQAVKCEKVGKKIYIYRFRTNKEFNKYITDKSYTESIARCLYIYLSETKEKAETLTRGQIMKIVGLVNENYMIGKWNPTSVAQLHREKVIPTLSREIICKQYITSFFHQIDTDNKAKIKKAIDLLCRQKVVSCSEIKYYIKASKDSVKVGDFTIEDYCDLLEIEREVIKDIISSRIDVKKEISNGEKIEIIMSVHLSDGSSYKLTRREHTYYQKTIRRKMLNVKNWTNYSTKYNLIVCTKAAKDMNNYSEIILNDCINERVVNDFKIKYPTFTELFISNNSNTNLEEKLKQFDLIKVENNKHS